MSTSDHNQPSPANRIDLVIRLTIVAELVMIASTWRLWFCTTDFPRVPLFALFLSTPTIIVQAVSAAFVVALMTALNAPERYDNKSLADLVHPDALSPLALFLFEGHALS